MEYDNAYPQRPQLIESIISEKSFTLIGGGAASGKSTVVFQGIEEWITTSKFFGYTCYRIPHFIYIAFDRVIEVVFDHLNRLKINFGDWVSLHSFALADLQKNAFHFPPVQPGDMVILDGLDMLVSSGRIKEFGDVNNLCRECKMLIDKTGISVIGLIGAVKSGSNGKSEGSNPMDKLLGAGVWQRISETNMLIEPSNPSDISDPRRYLFIRPRFEASKRMALRFGPDSRLHHVGEPLKTPEEFFALLKIGIHIKADLQEIALKYSTPMRTLDRWINHLCEAKKLIQVSRGVYRKDPPTNIYDFGANFTKPTE